MLWNQRPINSNKELADQLGIHDQTVVQWAKHGIVTRHAYNDHAYLYENPGSKPPNKHCSRWDRIIDRAGVLPIKAEEPEGPQATRRIELEEMQYEAR